MIAEQEQARRGEPVIVTMADGSEVEGTIEWGGVTKPVSIYTERAGRSTGRIGDVPFASIRPDPGGARPVWASLEKPGRWAGR